MEPSCWPIAANSGNKSALLNASTLTWSPTGTGKFDLPDEEAWALLPNGKVLTVDAYVGTGTCAKNTEIYDPSTGAWTSAGNVPAQLSDCNSTGGNNSSFEIGPNILTYNNSVMATGGTTSTTVAAAMALYNVTSNTWSAGANLPSTCGSGGTTPCNQADAPAAVMPNGNVLLGVSAGLFQPRQISLNIVRRVTPTLQLRRQRMRHPPLLFTITS